VIKKFFSNFVDFFSTKNDAYDAASYTRDELRGWVKPLYAPNDELSNANRTTMISRVLDSIRNNPLATAAIERFITEIVGTGLRPDVNPDVELLDMSESEIESKQREIERKFKLWCKSQVDIERENNFYSVQRIAYRSQKASGDVFVNTPIVRGNLYIQLIESERVSNANGTLNTQKLVDGLELSDAGEVTHIQVQTVHPGEVHSTGEEFVWRRFRVRDTQGRKRIFQVFERMRVGQRRGLPVLASVLGSYKQLDKFAKSELEAAVITGNPCLFIESPYESSLPGQTDYDGKEKIFMTPGGVVDLAPGESIKSPTPGRPNQQYEPFVRAKMLEISAALKIPLEVLLMNFSASFSASRAAFLMFKKVINEERAMFADKFCQPIFSIWLDNEVSQGRILINDYQNTSQIWKNVSWIGAAIGSIREADQLNAVEKKLQLGLSTKEKEVAELGHDYGEIQTKLAREMKNQPIRENEDDNTIAV